jgi:hypothetical protein
MAFIKAAVKSWSLFLMIQRIVLCLKALSKPKVSFAHEPYLGLGHGFLNFHKLFINDKFLLRV